MRGHVKADDPHMMDLNVSHTLFSPVVKMCLIIQRNGIGGA